ncbi:zinc finger protein 883-like isoform X1 [Spodoptera litura]|uniref:Zinc finger protein 883-like isoform X1 n=2 Tax=Spodoptera litura TaxID=69820 RepID=A0A9J7DXI4_SPOLT|nr:zinc finger protein 883-like isoform X1 [Spodoptera litura]XP_022818094.1 zinc finger protein 883-like isoform X1 [Spodoptera litura]
MYKKMCRLCLSTENIMFPLDESFVLNYNLLTNLKITLSDEKPQYSCIPCLDNVKCYIVFREKCIKTETILEEMVNEVKKEDEKSKQEIITKEKLEIEIEGRLEMDDKPPVYGDEDVDENMVYVIKEEIKEESDYKLDDYDVIYSDSDTYVDINNVLNKKEKVIKKHLNKKDKRNNKQVSTLNKVNTKKKKRVTEVEPDQWYCGICPKVFDSKTEMYQHIDSHKTERQCGLCKVLVNSLSQLYAHRLKHVPSAQYKCHICNKTYKSDVYLEFHYRNVHIEEDDKRLTCGICHLIFGSPKRLCYHMSGVHPKTESNYICDVCSKGFQNKTALKSHIRSHGLTKWYTCNLCDFSCKQSSGIVDHKKRKHNPQKVICKNCKKIFHNQKEYDEHKCKHIMGSLCPICGIQIKCRLNRHLLSHSDEFKYKCHRCPAKYKSRTALVAHLDRHDGNRTKQCEYCPAKFYCAAVLQKHRRIHTGEKPYVCEECNKGFTGKHNLKVHMKVHGKNLVVKRINTENDVTI